MCTRIHLCVSVSIYKSVSGPPSAHLSIYSSVAFSFSFFFVSFKLTNETTIKVASSIFKLHFKSSEVIKTYLLSFLEIDYLSIYRKKVHSAKHLTFYREEIIYL